MLAPGKTYPGDTKRLSVAFTNDDEDYVDPTTVVLVVRDTHNNEVTYTYGTDAALIKDSTGNYHCDVVPTFGGRWQYAWTSTGPTTRIEDSFLVQQSEFDGYSDDVLPAYLLWPYR